MDPAADVPPPTNANAEGSTSGTEKHVSVEQENISLVPLDINEPILTRKELWSYYLYYNGDNPSGPLYYTQTLFQSLATAAGYDPAQGPGSRCTTSNGAQCVLPWGSGTKTVSSVVLVSNGVSFAIMAIVLTTFGSAGDYGSLSRWLLLVATVICWAAQYACMALTSPSRWKLAMGLAIISFASYGITLVFYAAAFPWLARNSPYSRKLREKLENGEISAVEYQREESMEKNRISNISTVHSNLGWIATCVLNLPLLLAPATANNPMVRSYVLALDASYWVLLGIWWFIYQLPRPGPPLPKGEYYLTVGWKQLWRAVKTCNHLPYTFVYLVASFVLADGLNTTAMLVGICQNSQFDFSFVTLTYVALAQAVLSAVGVFGFWRVQRWRKIPTKTMFTVSNIVTTLIPLWGMIGIWTNKVGFHSTWEFWVYNVIAGFFQAPYFSFSQTMMAELSPPGFDNMFFGLFGFSIRVSSIVGPSVVQAIIDETGDNWQGFPFLFAICAASALVIWFGVDVEKGRRDATTWALTQRP